MTGTSAPGTPPSPSLFTAASLFTSLTHLSRVQPQTDNRHQRSGHSDDCHLQTVGSHSSCSQERPVKFHPAQPRPVMFHHVRSPKTAAITQVLPRTASPVSPRP